MESAGHPDLFERQARYELRGVLGSGSMGAVYRTYDRELGLDLALKTFHGALDPDAIYQLKQEFRALAGLRHDNLVQLYDLVVTEHDCFFTMEVVDGAPFHQYLRDPSGVRPDQPVSFAAIAEPFWAALRQVASGLTILHGAGRLHRDIKPTNVLVTPAGRVVLLDFGLATMMRRNQPQADSISGSPVYMAPEVLLGVAPSAALDWYSLGVMLYETLAGVPPFAGSIREVLLAKQQRRPRRLGELVPGLPAAVAGLVDELLEPDAAARAGAAAVATVFESRQVGPTMPIGLIGREPERQALRQAFVRSSEGDAPVIVHLLGTSGIGKSELAGSVMDELQESGATVLAGRCHPQEDVPYRALDGVIDDLSNVLLRLPAAQATELAPRHAGALLRLFPVLARVPALAVCAGQEQAVEPQEIRRRAVAALRELLAGLAERQPLVLWIDDSHWTDPDSGAVLHELLRPPAAPRLLLLLSHRREEWRDNAALLALREGGDIPDTWQQDIELGPLDNQAARQLAGGVFADQPELVDVIVRQAGGSPFFLTQLLHYLAGGEVSPHSAPRGLAALLEERFSRLPAAAKTMLEVVAVSGRAIERDLALGAADLLEGGRAALLHLERDNFLRSTSVGGALAVEVYHDRIREAVVGRLAEDQLRHRHHRLAQAWQSRPAPDPQAVFRHLLGAGERFLSAEWAVRAAQRSADALAFAEAADLYGQALQLRQWDGATQLELRRAHGQALVNVGRCAEAAPIFDAAASLSHGVEAAELRRLAAEQYLVSGHLNNGVDMLRRLAGEIGLDYPKSPARAMLGGLLQLVRLRWRGLEAGAFHAAGDPWPLVRIDTCSSAGRGLVVIDPIRGLYFSLCGARLALETGEPRRLVRSLSVTGANLLPVGGAIAGIGERMIAAAARTAAASDDPFLHACIATAEGQRHMLHGRWQEMLEACDSALQTFRDHCRGVAWECNVVRMGALRALEELGSVDEVARRSSEWMFEAEAIGDLYARVTAQLYSAYWQMAAGHPSQARRRAAQALAAWPREATYMQHFYGMRIDAYCDIYEDQPAKAWERIADAWPQMVAANLLRHTLLRADAHLLRARAGLALAAQAPQQRADLLKRVRADAAVLRRETRLDTGGNGALILAGCDALEGRRDQAARYAEEALQKFTRAHMRLAQQHAEFCVAVLGGRSGAASSQAMHELGIAEPQRWLRVHTPGIVVAPEPGNHSGSSS